MLTMFRSIVVLCAVISIEYMAINSMHMVSLYAVLSYEHNDQINLMQFLMIDHFHYVSILEIVHIECEQYLMVLKIELFDLDFPQH